jgi:hypothetical protein
VNPLTLARDLARFEADLQEEAAGVQFADQWVRYPHGELAPAIAASYLHLIARLPALGDGELAAEILAEAIGVYDEAVEVYTEAARRDARREDAARRQREAERDEAARRHEIAINAECPYCGVGPGSPCRSAGPSGRGYSKGVQDHRDRYRAAEHLFGPPGGDSDDELPF